MCAKQRAETDRTRGAETDRAWARGCLKEGREKKKNRERPPRAPGKSGLSAGAEPTVPRADGVKIFIKI